MSNRPTLHLPQSAGDVAKSDSPDNAVNPDREYEDATESKLDATHSQRSVLRSPSSARSYRARHAAGTRQRIGRLHAAQPDVIARNITHTLAESAWTPRYEPLPCTAQ